MSKEKSNFEHKIMDWAGVPKDVEPGVPVLTVTGRTDLCLENYKGILEYTDSLIRIKIRGGQICIAGSYLQIRSYTGEEMIISGTVDMIEYMGQKERKDA